MFFKSSPALEEINGGISPQELRVLKNQLDSEHPPSPQSQFNYAWGLLKSPAAKDQKQALDIFASLYRNTPALRRESLYYLALGSVKLGEYSAARRYTDQLLEKEPDNAQFKALKQALDDSVTQDGLIGLGVAGGVLAVGLGLIGAFAKKRR